MKNYLQYTIVDFIEEESFIRWANNESLENDFNWTEWLSEHTNKKDEANKARLLIKNIKFKEEENVANVENALWDKINDKIDVKKSEEPKKGRIIPLRNIFIAAASILLLLFFTGLLRNGMSTTTTNLADVQNITLPDGSKVILNSKSSLKYNKKNWEENRLVKLEGEAFFEVEKGSSFVVKTALGDVKVLGTSFNVYARNDEFNVICKSGKVQVISKTVDQLLMPNQSVKVKESKHEFIKEVEVVQERDAWIKGIYRYENEELINVVKEIERQFAFSIDLPERMKDLKFTGSFSIENNKNALSEVLWPLGLMYEIDGNKVIVREE